MDQENQIEELTDIEQLRQLIMGREADVLAALRERLDNPDLRAAELADVLVETIRISQAKGEDLAGAIEEPVQVCLKQSIEKDTQFFADALFPVMGPAIRKSITESLKALVQSINATVENSLSPQGLRWRFEAMRTGTSFGEVVLKHTLVYRVEQVLLVQRDTGLLMQHVERDDIDSKDGDAVSAMLTAIQDFVRDSFTTDGEQGGDLASVDVGDQTVWLLNSPTVTMACVIRGIAPMSLRTELQQVLESILRQFSSLIDQFEGDKATLEPVLPLMERCFGYEKTVRKNNSEDIAEAEFDEVIEERSEPQKLTLSQRALSLVKTPFFFIALLALSVFFWFFVVHWQENKLKEEYLTLLGQTPGVLVTHTAWADIDEWGFWGKVRPERKLIVQGLQDPSFSDADAVAKEVVGFLPERIQVDMQAYQSLESVVQLQRAEEYIRPPHSIRLQIRNGVLRAQGLVDRQWYEQWNEKELNLPGQKYLDLSEVEIDLTQEKQAYKSLKSRIGQHVFYFVKGAIPADWDSLSVQEVSQEVNQLLVLADMLDRRFHLVITAYSDAVGGEERNLPVRAQRKEYIRDLLVAGGVPVSLIELRDGGVAGPEGEFDLNSRKVVLSVEEKAQENHDI